MWKRRHITHRHHTETEKSLYKIIKLLRDYIAPIIAIGVMVILMCITGWVVIKWDMGFI